MNGGSFDARSIARISRAVRRVERMPLENPTDDGGEFAPMPAPVFTEVRIVSKVSAGSGSGTSGASGESSGGSGPGSGSGDCTIQLWSGQALVWNGCGWNDNGEVWVFHLGGDTLRVGSRYLTRVIESHYRRRKSDPASERPLCEAFDAGLGGDCTGGSGPGSGSGGCPCGIPIKWGNNCDDACLTIIGGRLAVVDGSGNVLAGG